MTVVKDLDERDMMFPCECHDDHFLRVTWWPGSVPDALEVMGWLSVAGSFRSTLRQRIAMAWRVLASDHVSSNVGIVLDGEKARQVAAELVAFADAEDSYYAAFKGASKAAGSA